MANLEQVHINGQNYLERRCTMFLGISPGNPHYFQTETLEKLFCFAEKNSDKVLWDIPEKVSEHNYRAIGSKNPRKSARKQANLLRKKCQKVMIQLRCDEGKYRYIKWEEEIESSSAFAEALQSTTDLYQRNEVFRYDVQENTKAALISMNKGRENAPATPIDIEEGVKYLLKELAFFDALPSIYENCKEFVLVYHRPTPIFIRYYGGFYDGVVKPSVGFVVLD